MSENLTGKKSWVHRANDNRITASDFDKKYRIVRILRDNFNMNALGLIDEFYYFRDKLTNEVKIDRGNPQDVTNMQSLFRKYEIQKMDLYVKQRKPDVIVEVDGLEHGFFDEMTESQQTIDRNQNYAAGGYKKENKNFLLITTEDLKEDDNVLVTMIEYQLGIRAIQIYLIPLMRGTDFLNTPYHFHSRLQK